MTVDLRGAAYAASRISSTLKGSINNSDGCRPLKSIAPPTVYAVYSLPPADARTDVFFISTTGLRHAAS